ncbi:Solute carrier family 35 member G1 [Halotydeus destructor]|nr:Solute carrier family 35 member G1 [Halotydeus destructor]
MSENKKLADDYADDGHLVAKLRKHPLAGISLATMAGIIFGTANYCVSLLQDVDPLTVLISRSLIQLMVFTPVAIFSGSSISGAKGERKYLYVNGVIGAIAVGSSYSAFQMMPLGDATTIVQSMLVWTTIFACVFLKEPCGPFQVVVVIVTFGGILLLSQPTFAMKEAVAMGNHWGLETINYTSLKFFLDRQGNMVAVIPNLVGITCALIASFGLGVSFILMRKLQKTPAGVTIIWMSIMSVVLSVMSLSVRYIIFQSEVTWRDSFSIKEWLLLLANGVCGVFAQLTLTVALKIEDASLTSIGRSSDIVIAYMFQVLSLSQPLKLTSMIGATLVLLCVIASALDKLRQSRLEQDTGRLEFYGDNAPSESHSISRAGNHLRTTYSSTSSA